MGDSEATRDDDEKESSESERPPPASVPFESAPSAIPPSEGRQQTRRSSIRPAPSTFKPTLRDSSKLPPPMVIHSGDADEAVAAWGVSDIVNHPSQVKVDKPTRPEPFALAEDLHLETLPFEFPAAGGIPSEAQGFVARESREHSALEADQQSPSPPITNALPEHPPPLAAVAVGPANVSGAVVSADRPVETKKRLLPAAIALALVGLCGAVFVVGRGNSSVTVVPERVASATPAAGVATETGTDPVTVPGAEPQKANANDATDHHALVAPTPAPSSSAESTLAARSTHDRPKSTPQAAPQEKAAHVRLVMNPPDAKVTRNGAAVPGPPYEFDVPYGKKISVEASHKGYATRKVTIDSSKPLFQVGLVAEKKHK